MRIILLASQEQKDELLEQKGAMPENVVWITDLSPLNAIEDAQACIDLQFDGSMERIQNLRKLKAEITIVNSVLKPLNAFGENWIRINGWKTFLKRPVVEAAGAEGHEQAETILSYFDKKVDWVADIAGFISARVVASIINEAWFALGEQLSTRQEIDTAMKLGTNYPYGPFEWGEKIGVKHLHALLEQLGREQNRYQPAPLLIKEANA